MTTGVDSLTIELTAADTAALKQIRYRLDRLHIRARFAAEPPQPGAKAAADLVPLLVVVVAGVTEARKVVELLLEARRERKPVIEVTVRDRTVRLENGTPDDLRKLIDGIDGA